MCLRVCVCVSPFNGAPQGLSIFHPPSPTVFSSMTAFQQPTQGGGGGDDKAAKRLETRGQTRSAPVQQQIHHSRGEREFLVAGGRRKH